VGPAYELTSSPEPIVDNLTQLLPLVEQLGQFGTGGAGVGQVRVDGDGVGPATVELPQDDPLPIVPEPDLDLVACDLLDLQQSAWSSEILRESRVCSNCCEHQGQENWRGESVLQHRGPP
jgi:hypothetical protein